MARSTSRQLRLKLFERGNVACPICLRGFDEAGVRAGRSVTLEHVPPRRQDGRPVCLTCAACNHDAGRGIDQAAADALTTMERGWKATATKGGVSQVGYMRDFGERLTLVLQGRPQISLTKPGSMTIRFRRGDSRLASISWLKSAYLGVFSLMGRFGYDYASADATHPIREQIMNPGKKVIEHFTVKSNTRLSNGIHLFNRPTPCWAVQIPGAAIVLLPTSKGRSFYKDGVFLDGAGSVSHAVGFPFHRFGSNRVGAMKAGPCSPSVVGWSGTGAMAECPSAEGRFVFVDQSDRHINLIFLDHPQGETRTLQNPVSS